MGLPHYKNSQAAIYYSAVLTYCCTCHIRSQNNTCECGSNSHYTVLVTNVIENEEEQSKKRKHYLREQKLKRILK